MVMLDFEEVIARVTQWPGLRLVAIDGLPLAGKSTLADRLAVAAGAECIRLDDFVKPEAEWRSEGHITRKRIASEAGRSRV